MCLSMSKMRVEMRSNMYTMGEMELATGGKSMSFPSVEFPAQLIQLIRIFLFIQKQEIVIV